MDRRAAIAAVKAPVLRRVFVRGVPAKPAGAVRPAMQPAIIRPLPTNIDNLLNILDSTVQKKVPMQARQLADLLEIDETMNAKTNHKKLSRSSPEDASVSQLCSTA